MFDLYVPSSPNSGGQLKGYFLFPFSHIPKREVHSVHQAPHSDLSSQPSI